MLIQKLQSKYLKYALWVIIILPGVFFVLTTLAYLGYLFWPYDLSKVTNLPLDAKATSLTISVHGVKDSPDNWSDTLTRVMLNKAPADTQHISLDWRPFSEEPLICSIVAKNIGEEIARRISRETNVKNIHAIGHSCGSFLIYGLCNELKRIDQTIKIQTTYLDPVSVYAGIFWDYGVDNFGNCADFSDAYIDTGDTVPGSNIALTHAFTFDVTSERIKQNRQEPPHNWPPQYYIQAYQDEIVPLLGQQIRFEAKYKKGVLMLVD